MKFAYADPPYLGLAKKFYKDLHPDAADYDKKEKHIDSNLDKLEIICDKNVCMRGIHCNPLKMKTGICNLEHPYKNESLVVINEKGKYRYIICKTINDKCPMGVNCCHFEYYNDKGIQKKVFKCAYFPSSHIYCEDEKNNRSCKYGDECGYLHKNKPKQIETIKEETIKEETIKEETIKEETIKEETIKEEPVS